MENNENVVADLKELLRIANDGKEGYESAEKATESPELKAVFTRLMGERIVYAEELKEHIAKHGGEADNDDGGILGGLHRTWLTIKQAFSSNEEEAILDAVVTGERAAIEKYDACIENYERHADHLGLLAGHREGIKTALAEIETLQEKYRQNEEGSAENNPASGTVFAAGSNFGITSQSAPGVYSSVSEAEQMGNEGITGQEFTTTGSDIPDAGAFDEEDETDTGAASETDEEFDADYLVTEETGTESDSEFDSEETGIDDDELESDENTDDVLYDSEDGVNSADEYVSKGGGSLDSPDERDAKDSFPARDRY